MTIGTGTGTIKLTGGSQAVVGVGTAFTKELGVGYGLILAQDVKAYQVGAIIDDTHLVLANKPNLPPGNTLSGLVFQYSNGDFTPNISLPAPGPHSPNSSAVLNRAWNILDAEIPAKS